MKLILTLLLSLPLQSSSFSPAARASMAANKHALPSTAMLMVKKRRRRKTPASTAPTTSSDELPDFDDGEEDFDDDDDDGPEFEPVVSASSPAKKSSTPVKRGAGLSASVAEQVGGNVDGLDEDTILEAMRGKAGGDSWQPPRSIQDTLSDRSLEKFMNFERMIEADGGGTGDAVELPDFDEVIARRKQREAMQEGRVEDAAMLLDTEGMGKKAARNAQRKAAAMQREAEMEEQKNPFEDLNILKLLENGAWVGIGLLVVWEIYINSPFFERAAPLIPVVYDSTPPGM